MDNKAWCKRKRVGMGAGVPTRRAGLQRVDERSRQGLDRRRCGGVAVGVAGGREVEIRFPYRGTLGQVAGAGRLGGLYYG